MVLVWEIAASDSKRMYLKPLKPSLEVMGHSSRFSLPLCIFRLVT